MKKTAFALFLILASTSSAHAIESWRCEDMNGWVAGGVFVCGGAIHPHSDTTSRTQRECNDQEGNIWTLTWDVSNNSGVSYCGAVKHSSGMGGLNSESDPISWLE